MHFDIDGDYIPGWTFGFGRIVTAGNGYMLIDADGTRRSYGGNPWSYSAPNTSLQGFDGYTKDGSYINYWARGYRPQYGSYILDAWAKLPNGTKIIYGASANLGAYPTQITDANGNYITITYVNNQGPQIDTITDTLGRQIKFKYVDLLVGSVYKKVVVAVTVPGFNGGTDRVVARFAYDTASLTASGSNYGFSGVTCRVQNATTARLKAIYYPATNTGYWFGESDSYSTYGMLRKVSERRGMACSNPDVTTAEANITNSGVMSREVVYEHTSQAGYSNTSGPLSDVPTYNQMTEDWSGRHAGTPHNVPKPVTEFSVTTNSSTVTTRITRRDSGSTDGLTTEQITDNNTSSQTYGLVLEDTTYPTKTSSTVLHKSKVYWEVPDLNTYPSHYGAPRPNHTEVTDERGQMTSTYYTYGVNYNQVADVREYGYNNQLLRRTHTEYINTTPYIGYWSNNPYGSYFGRHIYSLASSVDVYASDDTTRVSRTEYQYDQQSGQQLYNTPDVPQHELVSDPYDPGYQICDWVWNGWDYDYICNTYYTYDSGTDKRGNITSVKRYADALNVPNDPIALTETRNYDICGNLVTTAPACCEQTVYTYSIDTKYTWPSSVTHGLISDASQRNTTSTVYDLNTGLVTTAYDVNGLYSTTTYNTSSLRPIYNYGFRSSSSQPVGYTYHEYYDNTGNNDMAAIDFVYESGLNGASWANRVDKYLDGKGRVAAEIGFTAGYEMDVVATVYDQFGRVKTQSRPYRLNTSWGLVGTQEWTTYNYDIMNRVTSEVLADGSTSYRYYNESSYPSAATQSVPGNTLRVKDAWGRERWARHDEQNRLVEVVEPNPGGDGTVASNGLLTTYSYNTLGNLTGVNQGGQTRSFKFDSLGRLTNQHLAEREKTLDDSGGNGSAWSDYFKYDNRGNVIERRDARRVKTTFNYNSDPLNRLQSVSYDTSNAIDASTIAAASAVTYSYETTSSKDKTRLVGIELGTPNSNTTDFGEQSFSYDSEGRLSNVVQSYGSSRSATTNYEFDSLNRLSKIKYPAQYGQSGNPIREAVPTYDLASRQKKMTYNSTVMADNPVFNASSQTMQLDIGSAIQEQYTFDPKTGLLIQQKVMQGTTERVNLEYNYTLTNATNNGGVKTGQLAFVKDNLGTNGNRNRQFTYDKLGRLTQAQGGSSGTLWSQTYDYDRWGNRISVTKSGNSAGGGAIDSDGLASVNYDTATNRMTGTDFTYDKAGNQTKSNEHGQSNTYKYDAAGRLAEVTSGGNTHTYSYGASNQRLQMVEAGTGGSTTLYTWDGNSVIAEYNGANNGMVWTKSYVHLGGRVLATDSTGGIQYHHPDRLGTRLVTNTSGGVVSENIGLPFGNTIYGESYNLAGSASKKRFTSYDRSDITRLDYAVNRHYSAAQGRFTQVDPIEMEATDLSDPQSLNLFAYCGNDPINHTDPDGLFFKKLWNGLKKAFKWIGVALSIAIAVIAVMCFPALFATAFKATMGIISAIANAASSTLKALGYTTAANIFGIISAAANLGTSIANVKGAVKKMKAVFKMISDGASLASKTLSAKGKKVASQWFGIASTATGFVSGRLEEVKKDPNNTNLVTGFEWKNNIWETVKTGRSLAEQGATLAGEDKLAGWLNVAGLGEVGADIRKGIKEWDKDAPKYKMGEYLISKSGDLRGLGLVIAQSLWRLNHQVKTLETFNKSYVSILDKLEKGRSITR